MGWDEMGILGDVSRGDMTFQHDSNRCIVLNTNTESPNQDEGAQNLPFVL